MKILIFQFENSFMKIEADCQNFCTTFQSIATQITIQVMRIFKEGVNNRINGRSMKVFCEVTDSSEGWIVMQRRQDGSVLFKRNWDEYKNGFGDPNTEY